MREGIPIEKELFETLRAFSWINFESAQTFVDRKNILNVKNGIYAGLMKDSLKKDLNSLEHNNECILRILNFLWMKSERLLKISKDILFILFEHIFLNKTLTSL